DKARRNGAPLSSLYPFGTGTQNRSHGFAGALLQLLQLPAIPDCVGDTAVRKAVRRRPRSRHRTAGGANQRHIARHLPAGSTPAAEAALPLRFVDCPDCRALSLVDAVRCAPTR